MIYVNSYVLSHDYEVPWPVVSACRSTQSCPQIHPCIPLHILIPFYKSTIKFISFILCLIFYLPTLVSRSVLSPLQSFQQIHILSPVSTSVVSADPPRSRVSRSTSQSCQQIHLFSTSVVSADPPLAVLSPLQSCQQIHH